MCFPLSNLFWSNTLMSLSTESWHLIAVPFSFISERRNVYNFFYSYWDSSGDSIKCNLILSYIETHFISRRLFHVGFLWQLRMTYWMITVLCSEESMLSFMLYRGNGDTIHMFRLGWPKWLYWTCTMAVGLIV